MINKQLIYKASFIALAALLFTACATPELARTEANRTVPESYNGSTDSTNMAAIHWREFFKDPNLVALIDTALVRNQELNITLQRLWMAQNEIMARKGEYLPSVGIGAGGGVDKKGRYTPLGASEATTEIEPGTEMPEPVPDMYLGAFANWELDIWRRLRNSKDAAVQEYLASIEGKNFLVTQLVAEIARSYYELLALDNQLDILQQNIVVQKNALAVVRLQKTSGRVTELAVRRFEAQVFKTTSLQFDIKQKIVEAENRINFLLGRFPQPITRSSSDFNELVPASVFAGLPTQLLENRPDVKRAEYDLAAAELNVKVAKANFYPKLSLAAGFGYNGYKASLLFASPQSMMFGLAGELMAPLINRKAIKAEYYNANAKQVEAIYEYERTALNAYIEVVNELTRVENLSHSYSFKANRVEALSASVDISNDLFKSARADYMEVLLTQRDAMESKFELIETKMQQLNAVVNLYRALGGGWQ